MVALTSLEVAPTTRPFYEGVSPVSGATPLRLAASLRVGAACRGLKLNRAPLAQSTCSVRPGRVAPTGSSYIA